MEGSVCSIGCQLVAAPSRTFVLEISLARGSRCPVMLIHSAVQFYLNGTSLGTIPIASAGSVSGAGGVGEDGEQYDQDDHDDQGDDKDKSKDDGKDEGKDDKDSHTIDLTKHNPTPAPGESEDETDVLADIFEELLDKPNPLDEIKIGRKFML